jgi:hypothetical protein
MFLNAFTDHIRRRRPKWGRKHLTFDFVVAERPVYVPGSGPPLAPVTVMPAHDKDGFIEAYVQIDKKPIYIVSYEEHPYLRVSVKPENILNWVSPRTLEDWEFAQTQAENKRKMDERLPKIAAREQRKRLKEQGVLGKASRVQEAPQGRKRKRTPSPEGAMRAKYLSTSGISVSAMAPPSGPGRKRKQVDDLEEEQEAIYTSPRRPSLSTPVKQRGLADVVHFESEDEDSFAEDTTLLERQLNGSPASRSKLAIEITRSATTSPEPRPSKTPKMKKLVPALNQRQMRSGSNSSTTGARRRDTRSSSASGPSHRDSVAASSSREARKIYENLERKIQAKTGSIYEKYSYIGKKPQSQRQATSGSLRRQKSSTPQSTRKKSATPKPAEDDDSEYEVDAILADEYRLDKKGKHVLWYLIKWVGEWPNSWEPEGNVGTDAIAEYKEKKRAEQKKLDRSMMTLDGAASSGDGARAKNADLKGKGKEKIPFGAGGLGLEEDDSDEDSLFVKDRLRGPDSGAERKIKVPLRGQVIDDDDDDSDEF